VEYAQQWTEFLNDIRIVDGPDLVADLQVARSFVAPDSPLARLARTVVYETTLTAPPVISPEEEALQNAAQNSAVQRAVGGRGGQVLVNASNAASALNRFRSSEAMERELVDDHFAALREVVTGSADSRSVAQLGQGNVGLDSIMGLLNANYTALIAASSALSNGSLPPVSDALAKLQVTADTLPAPLREILLQMASSGSVAINHETGRLLFSQMQAAIGDSCRLDIEGHFPFALDSERDVNMGDFTRMFALGGTLDEFFTKTLAPFVDTSANPWRYKVLPDSIGIVPGPDLEPFQHAKAIREVFFDPQGKQVLWKLDLRVTDLDPTIVGLSIDIDGQGMVYQHGPVVPFSVTWPGPRGGAHVEMTANPRINPDTSSISVDGPWALLRLLSAAQAKIVPTVTGRTSIEFKFDGRSAVLDVGGSGALPNPIASDLLTTFQCPSGL
jgi:type VI secretion system protein ImpL